MSKPAIVIQCATHTEAKPFINYFHCTLLQQKPFKIFLGDSSLYILIGGIGITKAAIAATYICLVYDVQYIINIGAAGALALQLLPGDICCVKSVIDNSRYNLTTLEPFTYTLAPIDELQTCRCLSVTKPLRTQDDRLSYSTIADIVDMELAGIAYASYKFGKQCYSIKYISDTGQHTTHETIMNNIINFSEKTVDTILEILFSHALIK